MAETMSTDQSDDLDDEQFEARLRDPSLIATHEEAVMILEELDHDIAQIGMQIEAYSIEASTREMPEDRQAWLRRAAYAGAMKRNGRHRVIQRDRELRGTKNNGTPPKDPALKLARKEAFILELSDRKLKREADVLRQRVALEAVADKRTLARMFQQVCKERLPDEQFQALLDEAKARCAADKEPLA